MPDLEWPNEDADTLLGVDRELYVDTGIDKKVDPAALAGVEPPVEDALPPFTDAQIAFIENMMEETIKRLAVAVNVREGDNYSWYSNNEYFSVEVTLSYNKPDGPYNGEQISEASDGFTVHIPSTERGY